MVLTLTANEFEKYLVYKGISCSYTSHDLGLVEAKIDITPEEYLEYSKYLEKNSHLATMKNASLTPMEQMIKTSEEDRRDILSYICWRWNLLTDDLEDLHSQYQHWDYFFFTVLQATREEHNAIYDGTYATQSSISSLLFLQKLSKFFARFDFIDHKIDTIKMLRSYSGYGLKMCKDCVEGREVSEYL